jgi:4-hydroxybenzoate polyprenyltransferase
MRPHQWVKNVLVFAPLVLGHARDLDVWQLAVVAFAAMCAAASGAYIINDILDVDADRAHPLKRERPFAAGRLSATASAAVAVALLAAALALGFLLSYEVAAAVLGYVALTFAYSLWLKTVLAVDVLVLAALYCIRLLVGGVAASIAISPWTLAFAMFLFVSLALMKRYAELHNLLASGETLPVRRGYRTSDRPAVAALGAGSGMTSVLVIALYVNGEDVRRLYAYPNLLFVIGAVVMLWIMRLWLLASRGEMHEDPVLFAIKDPWSIALAAVAAAILAGAA